jgi:aminopeptidase
MINFEQRVERYAAMAVNVGVNVQPGQMLCIISTLSAAPFVREVTKQAYKIGAKYVHVDWTDEAIIRTRGEMSPEDGLSYYPAWHANGRVEMAEQGAAFLWIIAEQPDLLQGIDPDRIALSTKAQRTALQPFREFIQNNRVAWSIVAVPTVEWADKVFPDLDKSERIDALWEAIFSATRVDDAKNPVETWREHARSLDSNAQWLNERKFKELRYRGPGTDLIIGLPEGHKWVSAGARNAEGTLFIPNMPTEEVFTSPHRESVNGKVSSSKPLNYNGSLIDNFSFTFKDGRIVDFQAEKEYEVLKSLVETDDGSRYLGEIALVPYRSPISDTNLTFYNTLFDENAACHLAIGFAFPFCLEDGKELTKKQLLERGLNDSLTHIDFMIGREDLDIDGIQHDGSIVPLFRNGNWAF